MCRTWYDACNRPEIIESEKFVLHPGHFGLDMHLMENFIGNCRTWRQDIEFHALPLLALSSATIWERCGAHIKSLLIDECEMTDETMRNVFLHCSSLTKFYFKGACLKEKPIYICWKNVLDDLIKRKVVREKLLILQVAPPSCMLGRISSERLHRIFPSIQTLDNGYAKYFFKEKLKIPSSVHSFTLAANSSMIPLCRNPIIK